VIESPEIPMKNTEKTLNPNNKCRVWRGQHGYGENLKVKSN
jgi:hypothetical protein